MSDQDIFEENKNTDKTPPVETTSVEPSNNNDGVNKMLEMIVNSDGNQKYANIEEALKGSVHAQSHISGLEKQIAELTKANESGSKIDDLIDSIQSQQNSQSSDDKETPAGITLADIQKVVRETMTSDNENATQAGNIKTVTGKFVELYGEKASETLYGKAANLGFNKEDINSLIAKNPTAAMKILGVDEVKITTDVNTDVNSVNTSAFRDKGDAPAKSSMGYISTKQLTSDWAKSVETTNKRLNAH